MKKILQVFKKLFSKRQKKEKIYLCDPDKAFNCIKSCCWYIYKGPCKCTKTKEYAKLDDKGKPIVASDMDMFNDDYYDYWISESLKESQKKQGL